MADSWLCHQIVKEAHNAIIVADREGIIRLWNKGAEDEFLALTRLKRLANPFTSSFQKS